MTIEEQLATMTEEEQKEFIHTKCVEQYGENTSMYQMSEKELVLLCEERERNAEQDEINRKKSNERFKEYKTTGSLQKGFILYDDTILRG